VQHRHPDLIITETGDISASTCPERCIGTNTDRRHLIADRPDEAASCATRDHHHGDRNRRHADAGGPGYHPYLQLPGVERGNWRIAAPLSTRLVLDERKIQTANASRRLQHPASCATAALTMPTPISPPGQSSGWKVAAAVLPSRSSRVTRLPSCSRHQIRR
jgi:hypothetical protein